MPVAVGQACIDDMSDSELKDQCVLLLEEAGLKASQEQLQTLIRDFGYDPLTIKLLISYLGRWYAGRLNGLETLPELPKTIPNRGLRKLLTAFEHKLRGTSDLTLLYLLSLSDRPVPQQHMKSVFRSTLMERWLTRRDDYVRFLGPLGRLNEEHWHWVIENLRRLYLVEQPIVGQHDLLFVAQPIREHFRNNLETRSKNIYQQAHEDMQKLFQDTVVEFKQRYYSTPEIKTWISPEVHKELELKDPNEKTETAPKPVLWKQEELDKAQEQLSALRKSLGTLKTQTERLTDQWKDAPESGGNQPTPKDNNPPK